MVRASICFAFCMAVLAFSGCKEDPSKPEYWSKAIEGAKRSKDRARVVGELRDSPHKSAAMLPMLHQRLGTDKNADVKAAIARVLAELKDRSSIQPLSDALDLGDVDNSTNTMNKEIARALGSIGDVQATPTLLRLLKARDNYVRIEAINALGAMKAKSAVDTLIELATSETGEPFISKKAIEALGNIGDPKAVPVLVKMMFKERRGVSFYVESSFALYQIGPASVPALIPVVSGEDKAFMAWTKENGVIEPAVYAKAAQVLADLHAHAKPAEQALIKQLSYDIGYVEQLLVRMKAADALGRMRSTAAVPVLSKMLDEPEAATRAEYIRALVQIGDPASVPALLKAAQKGSWDAREPAIAGIAMLGGEKELATLEKLATTEEATHVAYCKTDAEYERCKDAATFAKKQTESILAYTARVKAAGDCKTDHACWSKKLDDPEAGVRERAAFELGRSGNAQYTGLLVKRLADQNLDTRYAAITAADWLVTENPEAFKTAKASLGQIEKQLEEEKGKTHFVKVNEDLRRLAVKLARTSL
jgi:HEAT repeat protein